MRICLSLRVFLKHELTAGPSSVILGPSLLEVAAVAMSERRARMSFPPRWLRRLMSLTSRLMTKRTWVATMFLLGTFDLILCIFYLVRISDNEFIYSLIIGPPPTHQWAPLCFFTVLRTLLYFPETANTFSAMCHADGDTMIPLHLELIGTLSLEHIPLAAVDFFLSRCWRLRTSHVGYIAHIVRLVYLFVRIVWYAHIEGKKCRKNDKHEISQVIVMICFMLFAICATFPITNWSMKTYPNLDSDLKKASVFLIHHSEEETVPAQKYIDSVQCAVGMCSWPVEFHDSRCIGRGDLDAFSRDRWKLLVDSVWTIREKQSESVSYQCNKDKTRSPNECYVEGGDETSPGCALCFRFHFIPGYYLSPHGLLAYNFARRCPSRSKRDNCTNSASGLTDGWQLVYYEANRQSMNNVSLAFHRAYVQPKIKYDASIDACAYDESDDVNR